MRSVQNLNGLNDFTKTFERFAKNWPYFLICIIASLAFVYGKIYLTSPQYKISSTLLIQDDKNGAAMSNTTAFSELNMFQTVKTVDNEIEILKSRDLIYKVLSKLNLETTYHKKVNYKTIELYGKTLPVNVEVLNLKSSAYARNISIAGISDSLFRFVDNQKSVVVPYGSVIQTPNFSIRVNKGLAYTQDFGDISVKFRDLYALTESYSLANLKIFPVVKDANTVVISINDNLTQRGVDILTELIQEYDNHINTSKQVIAQNTIKFIDDRLKSLVSDLSGTEKNIESFKQQNQISDVSIDAQLNNSRSSEYDQMLSSSTTQLNLIRSIEKYFNSRQGESSLAPSAMGIKDPVLNVMIAKFNELQLERNRMLRTASGENPLVLNLNGQLSSLKANILENLNSIKNGYEIERSGILANYSQYKGKSKAVPFLERGLLELSRKQSVKSGIYQYLIQKREETALSLSTTVPTFQIIDKPAYNTIPESPKTNVLYLCGFLFGCFVPASIIYVRGFFNNTVKDARSIELTGAKMLGELSHNLDKQTNVFQRDNRSTISELFRYIRMNLGFMTREGSNKVILVTSSMKGEGKTFFSINLATTLGMLDKKVVILEFDLRRPALLNNLKLSSAVGLSDYLTNEKISLEDIIQPVTASENVSVIGCGEIPQSPAEVMMSERVGELIDTLKDRFDYIIIDTSPVGQVADAFSLASYVDVSIYLVRYNYTKNYQLSILKDISEENKLKNLLVVFNDAKRDKNQKYNYSGYGYAMTN
ncbi:Tyrosine-protein kinase ptk [compost metagenome]